MRAFLVLALFVVAPAEQPSGLIEHSIAIGGAQRTYLLADPGGAAPAPLVIALHGGGGNAETMAPRWLAKARAEGFIVALPNGVGRAAGRGTWNAGGCCAYAMTSGSDDVAFVAAVIDDVQRVSHVDPRRIYVTGMSNGAMLAHRVGIALAPRLAGVGIVAGAMFGDEKPPAEPLPVVIVHGAKDTNVPFDGGDGPNAARVQSQPYKPVRYAVDFWVRADGCAAAPRVETSDDVTVETYQGCRKGAEVRLYRLASAAHTWPGSVAEAPQLEGNTYMQLNATDALWDFFKRHRRP